MNSLEVVTLFAQNIARSRALYAHVFGREIVYEDDVSCLIKRGGTLINLLQSTSAPELVAPLTVGSSAVGA